MWTVYEIILATIQPHQMRLFTCGTTSSRQSLVAPKCEHISIYLSNYYYITPGPLSLKKPGQLQNCNASGSRYVVDSSEVKSSLMKLYFFQLRIKPSQRWCFTCCVTLSKWSLATPLSTYSFIHNYPEINFCCRVLVLPRTFPKAPSAQGCSTSTSKEM